MLQSIRDHAQGIFIWTIVGLIILSFALWGMEGLVGGGGQDAYVATVEGVEIDRNQLLRAEQNRVDELKRMLGDSYRPGLFNDDVIRRQALEGLINRAVMLQLLDRAGFAAAPEQIRTTIQSMPAFQEQDGRFSMARYEQALGYQGISPAQFERDVARDIAAEQLYRGIVLSAFATPAEVERYRALLAQTRDVGVLTVSAAPYLATVEVDDAEVRAFYEQNPGRFMTPARVAIEYLDLSLETIAGAEHIDEAQIRQYYEANQQRFMAPEQRRARHILVATGPERSEEAAREMAETLHEQLEQGASFEALAREHSDDPGSSTRGGDLGFFTRGVMDPAFDAAVFALEPGAYSEPVRTQFGYHLIQLEAVQAAQGRPLESVREEITNELRLQAAEPQFYEVLERATNLAYEHPESLEPAAEELGLELRQSGLFSRDGGSGVAENAAVAAAAFSPEVLEDGLNSDPVEVEPNHYVILRVRERQPAEQQPLELVADDIREQLRRERAHREAMETAEEAAERLRAGGAGAELAAENTALSWVRVETLSREQVAEDMPVSTQRRAFELARPVGGEPSVETLRLPSGDAAVIAVYGIAEGQPAEQSVLQPEALAESLGNNDFTTLLQQARDRAKVEINESAF